MSNTCTITVPPGTDLRNVLSEASSFTDVRIILEPGKHTWWYNSRWEYDPVQGWYLDGNDGEPGAGICISLRFIHRSNAFSPM